ncbi:membrane dipeptidase [Streptomyces zhihengii]
MPRRAHAKAATGAPSWQNRRTSRPSPPPICAPSKRSRPSAGRTAPPPGQPAATSDAGAPVPGAPVPGDVPDSSPVPRPCCAPTPWWTDTAGWPRPAEHALPRPRSGREPAGDRRPPAAARPGRRAVLVPAPAGRRGGRPRGVLELLDLVRTTTVATPEGLLLATAADDLVDARNRGRTAVLLGPVPGPVLGDSLAALRALHALGVRSVTLAGTRWAGSGA